MGPLLRLLALAACALLVLAIAPAAHAAADCDTTDPAACLLPWPNDAFTKADPTTDTGRRLDLPILGMPRNIAGKPIDPTDYNRNDGFSPGSLIITRIEGLDTEAAFARNDLPPLTDPKRSFDPKADVVLIDADQPDRPRQLIWAELEYPASAGKASSVQTVVLHPAKQLTEGHRYVVAFRDLERADGTAIEPAATFKALRDGTTRTDRHDRIFDDLRRAGVKRDDLVIAWDFTVASERGLSERALHLRDDAFAQLGDTTMGDLEVQGRAPQFVVFPDLPDDTVRSLPSAPVAGNAAERVDGVTEYEPCGTDGCQPGENDRLLRKVQGRVLVPCYLSTPGCTTGGQFVYGTGGLPTQLPGNTAAAPFTCTIPRSVLTRGPARPTLYGHGLLGEGSQVTGGALTALANEQNLVMCGVDWAGMATEDLPNIATLLVDLSRFATLADRGQQGMLNFLHVGRDLIHPDGFATDAAFQVDGESVIDPERLFYVGGSQGGIMGGALTAIAPDFTRAALGVPGMNYSILLQRSIDFDTYAQIMYNAYPDELQRPLILSLVQLLWDRAESAGYAAHMTSDPYPDTPKHEVVLGMAWGDHQVTNWSTLVMARTIGAQLRTPALEDSRRYDEELWGIEPIRRYPHKGSELLVADVGPLRTLPDGRVKGTPMPPVGNEPNRDGVDPHGPDASEQVYYRSHLGTFLRPDDESVVAPVCGEKPCYLDGWDGP